MSDGASVRRVDDRLGLAVLRAGLSGRTLVTYARDHVSVRTPSRPDLSRGNTLDLEAPPAPEDLPRWLDRFRDTIGIMGAEHQQLRWEEPVPAEVTPAAPVPDRAVATAAREHGLELSPVTVMLLDELAAPSPSPALDIVPVEAPSAVPGGAVDRRWHASAVLYRYLDGGSPAERREWTEDLASWSIEVQRELTAAGRCQVWVAMRHGGPVARLSLLHDRQGLAVVQDVVTHPVHRGLGIAGALIHRAITHHLEGAPDSRIGIEADPSGSAERLYHGLGFRPHATVWTALRPRFS